MSLDSVPAFRDCGKPFKTRMLPRMRRLRGMTPNCTGLNPSARKEPVDESLVY